jgi:hypothetical protein
MNASFPDHHVAFDHYMPLVYFPYDEPRFGTKAQMDAAWIVLSAVDENCERCALPAIKAMAEGDVDTILVLMRLVNFWVSATIWPGVGSDHETAWRAHLIDGFDTDPRSIETQREGIIGEMCRKYVSSLPDPKDRNSDYRIARAEHWEAVRGRGR